VVGRPPGRRRWPQAATAAGAGHRGCNDLPDVAACAHRRPNAAARRCGCDDHPGGPRRLRALRVHGKCHTDGDQTAAERPGPNGYRRRPLSGIGTLGGIMATFITGFVLLAALPTSVIVVSLGLAALVLGLGLWVGRAHWRRAPTLGRAAWPDQRCLAC